MRCLKVAHALHHDPPTSYPVLANEYGYRTCYETMSLSSDPSVPSMVKESFRAKHFLNMRFRFPPTPAYTWLLELAHSFGVDQTFVWTSNVDGCFERAGFDKNRVYTTQGEMNKYQCQNCNNVWPCEAQLRAIEEHSPDGTLTDPKLALKCPLCGVGEEALRPSLRGGNWLDHSPYEEVQDRLLAWLDDSVANGKTVAVLEVGVGPNTPVVTR